MEDKNIRWNTEAELIRRVGRKGRASRVEPGNVDRISDKLRGNNQRKRGEQPIKRLSPLPPTAPPQKRGGGRLRVSGISFFLWETLERHHQNERPLLETSIGHFP